MFGLILVILGVLFLFQKMEIIQGDFWGYFWPIILIVLGLNIIKKSKGGINCYSFSTKKHKPHNDKHYKVVDEQ
ncbi:MAG: hypothetical protein HOE19_04415 [Candidatus Komeilibacteria bacterium]|jgi:hypothetical protein|nr:hypothetical protein [Candidatus Komeilibacteria bacterium]MBT4447918.1 hypothetical protein [Candidatus Komeilibacteria bacterium]